MNWLIVLMVMAIAAVLWWRTRGLSRPAPATGGGNTTPRRKPPRPWQAVSIVHEVGCCDAVVRIGRKRFLAREAPPLPLPECTMPNCTCRYEYHTDRRDGLDRRFLRSASSVEMEEQMAKDSHRSPGRRSADHAKARRARIPPANGQSAEE